MVPTRDTIASSILTKGLSPLQLIGLTPVDCDLIATKCGGCKYAKVLDPGAPTCRPADFENRTGPRTFANSKSHD